LIKIVRWWGKSY